MTVGKFKKRQHKKAPPKAGRPPSPRPHRQAGLPGKKKGRNIVTLAMDNATYHHQVKKNHCPGKMAPVSANKGLNAHVLRTEGCTEIKVHRKYESTWAGRRFEIPTTLPKDHKHQREYGGKAPGAGAAGMVYARGGKDGPTKEELANATVDWLKASRPGVLFSKAGAMFDHREFEIAWTPPYYPKFQPIELTWGAAK